MSEPTRSTKIVPRVKTLECVWCKRRVIVPALSARALFCTQCGRQKGPMEPVKK